jgi:hypothetical protein
VAESACGDTGFWYLGMVFASIWMPPHPNLPYRKSVGYAVLILGDQRCVPGWLETPDGSDLPEGEIVTGLPAGTELRTVYSEPVWDPALHNPVLGAMILGVMALLGVSLGVGTFETLVLAAVAFASPPRRQADVSNSP